MLPERPEDVGPHPLLEAVVGRGPRAETGDVQGLPLAAGAQHEEDGLHADAVGRARTAASEAVRVLVFGQQRGDGLPQVVGDAPLIGDGMFVHGGASA